jgi:hypothetical protein
LPRRRVRRRAPVDSPRHDAPGPAARRPPEGLRAALHLNHVAAREALARRRPGPQRRDKRGGGRPRGARAPPRKQPIDTSIQIGKYLVSPLIRLLPDGRYGASVSIRSGQGSSTHDRVLRFIPEFDCAHAASRYATTHAAAWVGERSDAPTVPQEH